MQEPCQSPARQKTWDVAYWNMQMVFQRRLCISMLLMGRLMDVLGLRWGFVFACACWGLASMSHAFAPEIGSLFGSAITGFYICRILLGLGEGGNFPAAIKTTAEWFPKRERALATGLFNSGSNVGGLLVPWALPLCHRADHRRHCRRLAGRVRHHRRHRLLLDHRLAGHLPETRGTSPREQGGTGPHPGRYRRAHRQDSLAPAAAAQTDVGLCRGQVHDRLFLVVLPVRLARFLQ